MSHEAAIVVTGAGLALPLGLSMDGVWSRLVRGESAIGPMRVLDTARLGVLAAAEVPAFDLASRLRFPKNEKFMGRSVRFGLLAALDAVAASAIDFALLDAYRVGIHVGSGQTGLETAEFFGALDVAGEDDPNYRNMGGRAARMIDRYWSLRTLSNAGLGLLSMELGAKGSSANFVQGDTASSQAIIAGCQDLAEGRCDVVLAGGYDSLLTASTCLAYARAGLLSAAGPETAGRPFDRARDGLVLGEGAGFLVLERHEDARRRGAPILGALVGFGSSMEAGEAPPKASARSFTAAVGEATSRQGPDFVMAHGIGTVDADEREAGLLQAQMGSPVAVTAVKGATGYLGAATGAVEIILALLAARHRAVPPIAHLAEPDEGVTLDLVRGTARRAAQANPAGLCLSWSWTGQLTAVLVAATTPPS